jgi:hypothetical protein
VEDVSDEQAVDAFSSGLRRSDLIEELGRTNPRTISELMEVANRFANREDAYNNKRARSPEVDRASRQRQRARNEDRCTRRNQIAVGYERKEEEGYESREFQSRINHGEEKPKYSGPSAEDMLHGPCRIHYAYLDGKRVSNHQMRDCRTFLGCKVLWTRTKEHVRVEIVQVKDTKCSVSQNIWNQKYIYLQ